MPQGLNAKEPKKGLFTGGWSDVCVALACVVAVIVGAWGGSAVGKSGVIGGNAANVAHAFEEAERSYTPPFYREGN